MADDEKKVVELSDRERDVLTRIGQGMNKQEISKDLHISYHTVDFHIRSVLVKFKTNKSIVAVIKAMQEGLIKVEL